MSESRNVQTRIANAIIRFAGTMPFLYLHAAGVAGWMLFVEKSPWPTLILIVSLEAVFLVTLVMIRLNHQAEQAVGAADIEYQPDDVSNRPPTGEDIPTYPGAPEQLAEPMTPAVSTAAVPAPAASTAVASTAVASTAVASAPAAEPETQSQVLRHVMTYRWTDSHGNERSLDIRAGSADNPIVLVYAPDQGDGTILAAGMSREGRFTWSAQALKECGMDTRAARNDLVETCRMVHLWG